MQLLIIVMNQAAKIIGITLGVALELGRFLLVGLYKEVIQRSSELFISLFPLKGSSS